MHRARDKAAMYPRMVLFLTGDYSIRFYVFVWSFDNIITHILEIQIYRHESPRHQDGLQSPHEAHPPPDQKNKQTSYVSRYVSLLEDIYKMFTVDFEFEDSAAKASEDEHAEFEVEKVLHYRSRAMYRLVLNNKTFE